MSRVSDCSAGWSRARFVPDDDDDDDDDEEDEEEEEEEANDDEDVDENGKGMDCLAGARLVPED